MVLPQLRRYARALTGDFAWADDLVQDVTERALGRVSGSPRVTIDAVRMGRKKMFVSSTKAERELGWSPRPVDAALQRAVEWFRANAYVP